MTLVAGSYERFLFGYSLQGDAAEVSINTQIIFYFTMLAHGFLLSLPPSSITERVEYRLHCGCIQAVFHDITATWHRMQVTTLQREFNYPAHKGAVKCIATAASFLASGGADDLIHLYDIHVSSPTIP